VIRVRFAPSPTGYLHIGGARTALFNWLYARRNGGTFVLRIEDTDTERSSWEMVSGIVDGLRWLGLDWDEGPDIGGPHAPYFQSQRLEMHRERARQLVTTGHAYYCFCSPEVLNEKRQAAEAAGGAWIYDRTCCALTPDEIAGRESAGEARAIRFKVPPGRTGFADLVHGPIEFPNEVIEDFVVLRSDQQPTYHLSVVVDDIDMAITHVIRGDDHISNTPKQALLYGALGSKAPSFGHVPLIMGPDKKRLSKRHGATSVMEYQRLGYLPEAMVNFLALLGWSPGGDQEIFTRDELVAQFGLDGISGGNAVFNPEKLDWVNQQHLMQRPAADLIPLLRPSLEAAGLWNDDYLGAQRPWLVRVIELMKPRIKTLESFNAEAQPMLADQIDHEPAAVSKHLSKPELRPQLEALTAAYAAAEPFAAPELERLLRAQAEVSGGKAGPLIHATRVAVTGRANSPGLFDVLELIGKERVVDRLRAGVALISAN
jgi:glutamyl-tRNA synthetase